MTKAERRKLARAARELAMECVAGTAPEFGTGSAFLRGEPNCAMGHVNARAGVEWNDGWAIGETCSLYRTIASANDSFRGVERMNALVFPLLWAADELESQP